MKWYRFGCHNCGATTGQMFAQRPKVVQCQGCGLYHAVLALERSKGDHGYFREATIRESARLSYRSWRIGMEAVVRGLRHGR